MHPLAKLLPFSALCLGLGLGIAFFSARPEARPPAEEPRPAHVPTAPARETAPAGGGFDSLSEPAALARRATPPAASDSAHAFTADEAEPASTLAPETRDRLISEIEAAYTTYQPEALPVLARFLAHSDLEIRAFARDAIVQVGHADGAAHLRAAAREARDPRESAALLDAAEFLEIPPAPPLAGAFKPRTGKGREISLRRDSIASAP